MDLTGPHEIRKQHRLKGLTVLRKMDQSGRRFVAFIDEFAGNMIRDFTTNPGFAPIVSPQSGNIAGVLSNMSEVLDSTTESSKNLWRGCDPMTGADVRNTLRGIMWSLSSKLEERGTSVKIGTAEVEHEPQHARRQACAQVGENLAATIISSAGADG